MAGTGTSGTSSPTGMVTFTNLTSSQTLATAQHLVVTAYPKSYISAATYPNSYGFVVGDFNGDGFQDLAVDTGNNDLYVYLGNGDGTFQAPKITTGRIAPTPRPQVGGDSEVVGDFNGDGNGSVGSRRLSAAETYQPTLFLAAAMARSRPPESPETSYWGLNYT